MTPTYDTILLVHAISTWAMAGLIWFVQIVHYPLFGFADRERYGSFQAEHMRRTTWVVGPLMLAEGASCVGLLILRWEEGSGPLLLTNAILLFLIWVSTAVVQVPKHNLLLRAFDARAHRQLVRGNWVRTAAWTARGAIVAGLVLGS